MSDIPPQPAPQQKLTPEYIYALDMRIRELEQQNSQLQEKLRRVDNEFGQVITDLETQASQAQDKVTSLETNLGLRLTELGRQSVSAQRELMRQIEVVEGERLPKTMLLSDNFLLRCLTIYGHILVISLVIGLFFGCLGFVIGLISGFPQAGVSP
jgi:septal ring factor EnvC (AmiA/AmiB activator)